MDKVEDEDIGAAGVAGTCGAPRNFAKEGTGGMVRDSATESGVGGGNGAYGEVGRG